MSNGGSLIPYKCANCGALARDNFLNFKTLTNEFNLEKGCVVFFNFHGGYPVSDYVPPFPSCEHVGIAITDVDSNGNFKSIEGNTGDTTGGEVLLQTRNIKDVSCVGHPKYTKDITADMVIATAKKDVGYKSPSNQINKFNTWFYGGQVAGDWCATAVCYWFYHTESGGKSNMIDVSSNNGTIDWKKVKADGVKYAIIRIGWGDLAKQKDSKFEENYKNAKANGIKVGGYWVCYCGDEPQLSDYVTDAKLEAKVCLSIIKGKTFDLPIYHDLEAKSTQTKKIQDATMAFCKAITEGGYQAGVYASNDFFDGFCDYKTINNNYYTWVAQYSSKCSKSCDAWQYSDSGSVNGISTKVDLDKLINERKKIYVTVKWRVMGKGFDNRVGQVKDWQRILKECGYAVDITGLFDDKTEEETKRWQKKHGHAVTGIMNEDCIKDALSSD